MTWLGLCVGLLLAPPEPVLRVALNLGSPQVVIGGSAQIVSGGQATPAAGPLKAVVEGTQVRLGTRRYATGVEVRPTGERPLQVEIRPRADRAETAVPYRGSIVLHVTRKGTLLAVNHVGLEAYLRSVVPLEIGASAPPAALEAQAIAARSFAASYRGDGTKPVADLAVEYTQAYRGSNAEKPATDDAVTATAGQLLMSEGKPLQALYSQCCGGVNATAEETWRTPLPCLVAAFDEADRAAPNFDENTLLQWLRKPHGWCQDDPTHRWTRRHTWARLSALLASRLPKMSTNTRVGELTELRVDRRGPSGRVQQLVLIGREGQVRVNGELARRLLPDGEGWLPSSLFVCSAEGNEVVIRGAGSGHGVGLCQAGAIAQAQAGRGREEILRFYYPGATLGVAP